MKVTEQFEKEITPFFWVEHEESASVCLNVGEYLQEIFDTRAGEGFEGNGYDWGSLAQVFLDEQCSDLQEKIGFDPEVVCSASIQKIKMHWQTLFFVSKKPVRINTLF